MNNITYRTQIIKTCISFCLIAITIALTGCKEEDNINGPITVKQVYLQDVNSTIPDRPVTFGRLGQLLRIEGSGFTGLSKVYINGFDTYFNPLYVSDNSMLVGISRDTPVQKAEAELRNTIRFVNSGHEATIPFDIRASAPVINGITNTLPKVGELFQVNGSGLTEINKVTFPGGIEVTENIVSDSDGEFFTIPMPEGVSEEGGYLFVEGANGGAYSPAYFNFKKGVILDFDGTGNQASWSDSHISSSDLENALTGDINTSQGNYAPHRPARIASFEANKNRLTETWTDGNADWRSQFTPYIAPETPLDQVAFQFDIYVPQEWENTGYLKICLLNDASGGQWDRGVYNFIPWLVEGGETEGFQTDSWTTVTIPMTSFYIFSEPEDAETLTFEDLLAYREDPLKEYKNFGVWFENSDFNLSQITGIESDSETEFISSPTDVSVYTDNWRLVSIETLEYSDFPE